MGIRTTMIENANGTQHTDVNEIRDHIDNHPVPPVYIPIVSNEMQSHLDHGGVSDWNGAVYKGTGVHPLGTAINPPKITPDGMISGSTSRGSYVLYPNGTLKCNEQSNGGLRWLFPIADTMGANGTVLLTVANSSFNTAADPADRICTYSNKSSAGVNIHAAQLNGNASSVNVMAQVVGRWK